MFSLTASVDLPRPLCFDDVHLKNQIHAKHLQERFLPLLLDQNNCRMDMELWKTLVELVQVRCAASHNFLSSRVNLEAFVSMVAQMYPAEFAWFHSTHCKRQKFPQPELRFLQEHHGLRVPHLVLRQLYVLFAQAQRIKRKFVQFADGV